MTGGHAKDLAARGPAQPRSGTCQRAYKPRLTGSIGKACPYCSHMMEATGHRHVSREHILPRIKARALKGALRKQINKINCINVCAACNEEKGAKTLHEYMLFVLRLSASDAMRLSQLIDELRLKHPPHVFLALTGSPA